MPPRIFIQTGIRLGQKSQFNSKNSFSWKCQAMALPHGHLPKESITGCSPASWPMPCLPQLSQNHLTQHGRGWGGRQGAQLPHNQEDHSPPVRQALQPPWCPLRSQPLAASDLSLPRRAGMGASRRVEGSLPGSRPPPSTEAQGPDSPDLAPASPPQGSQYIF